MRSSSFIGSRLLGFVGSAKLCELGVDVEEDLVVLLVTCGLSSLPISSKFIRNPRILIVNFVSEGGERERD